MANSVNPDETATLFAKVYVVVFVTEMVQMIMNSHRSFQQEAIPFSREGVAISKGKNFLNHPIYYNLISELSGFRLSVAQEVDRSIIFLYLYHTFSLFPFVSPTEKVVTGRIWTEA